MGRIEADASHDLDEIPPAASEEDLYEPPADYQPPPQLHSFPPPSDHDAVVKPQAFPPQTPQPFPPNSNQYTFLPQPQQINNSNNVNIPQQGIPMPSPLIQNQPWNTHLFDCMKDPQNAIITLFFPCITFGQIAEVLDNGSTSCATSGILYSLIACCIAMPCLMSCGYRSKLRAKFGLVETPAPDFLIHCFCECCALCQEYRELSLRGLDPSIGHSGNVAKQQQMQMQFGMTPPMQQRMNF